jgi:hypothetical protein
VPQLETAEAVNLPITQHVLHHRSVSATDDSQFSLSVGKKKQSFGRAGLVSVPFRRRQSLSHRLRPGLKASR